MTLHTLNERKIKWTNSPFSLFDLTFLISFSQGSHWLEQHLQYHNIIVLLIKQLTRDMVGFIQHPLKATQDGYLLNIYLWCSSVITAGVALPLVTHCNQSYSSPAYSKLSWQPLCWQLGMVAQVGMHPAGDISCCDCKLRGIKLAPAVCTIQLAVLIQNSSFNYL